MKDQRINTKHFFLLEFNFFFAVKTLKNDLLGKTYYRL